MENNSHFPKSSVKVEIIDDTKLNQLQNGGCTKNDERLIRGKADTLPPLYMLASGHQLSHPLTMFDSVSPKYGFILNLFHLDSPCPPAVLVKKMEVNVKAGFYCFFFF